MKFGIFWRAVGVGIIVAGSARLLHAQDVIVSDPAWLPASESAGLQLPSFTHRPRPDFPPELKKVDQVNYALLMQYLRTDGRLATFWLETTHPYLKDVIFRDPPRKLRPATTVDGREVEVAVWYSYIFNPKSASPEEPDAAPRLLTVTPVFAEKGAPKLDEVMVVRVKVAIDADGKVERCTLEKRRAEPFREQIERAVAKWTFAPARRSGAPVAAELSVPVLVLPAGHKARRGTLTPPVIRFQAPPIYPISMRREHMAGEVEVDFIVDTLGDVREPTVTRSTNPAFDQPAIDAVKRWKFKPALQDGRPINEHLRVPMVFDLGSGGRDLVTLKPPKNQDKIPEVFRFDVAPQIRGVALPVYPYELLRTKTKGSARVIYLVDKRGKVTAVRVVEASRPEFGLALTAAMNAYEFLPALKKGVETDALVSIKEEFDPHRPSALLAPEDLSLLRQEMKHPESFVMLNQLDAPLKPISRRAPVFPCNARGKTDHGEALIEILVDKDGKVRLPRIVSATDPDFGYSAVQAVRDWSFEPPKSHNKLVVVRTRIPFEFNLAPAEPAGGPARSP